MLAPPLPTPRTLGTRGSRRHPHERRRQARIGHRGRPRNLPSGVVSRGCCDPSSVPVRLVARRGLMKGSSGRRFCHLFFVHDTSCTVPASTHLIPPPILACGSRSCSLSPLPPFFLDAASHTQARWRLKKATGDGGAHLSPSGRNAGRCKAEPLRAGTPCLVRFNTHLGAWVPGLCRKTTSQRIPLSTPNLPHALLVGLREHKSACISLMGKRTHR